MTLKRNENRASSTAVVVALGVLKTALTPQTKSLVPDSVPKRLEVLLRHQGWFSSLLARGMHFAPLRAVLDFIESKVLPGMSLHLSLRKRIIEEEVRRHIGSGIRTLVVIGAGFDILGERLAVEKHDLKIIEADLPGTQNRRKLFPGSKVIRETFTIGKDRVSDLVDSQGTLFLLEGVVMYLQPEIVENFFQEASAAGVSRIIFTEIVPDKAGKVRFASSSWLSELALTYWKEPFRFGVPEADLSDFLNRLGWRVESIVHSASVLPDYLAGSDLLTGEVVVSISNTTEGDSSIPEEPPSLNQPIIL